jgi:hypothetical protein
MGRASPMRRSGQSCGKLHPGIAVAFGDLLLVRGPSRLSTAPLNFDCRNCFPLRRVRNIV